MSVLVETGTFLDRILERTSRDVAARKQTTSMQELEARAGRRPPSISLREALAGPGVSVIAEIKRASPSRGVFPVVVDPPAVAGAYLDGGASALSVLTDEPFFHGSVADLESACVVAHGRLAPAPVLRKDFVLDPYQVVEARAAGADAILLIVAALVDDALARLNAEADRLGMDVLVEVHDERELDRALALGARLVGINNRNLHTFAVDLATSERLAPLAGSEVTVVGESGIFSRGDVEQLEVAGVDAVLVGEGLILQEDRETAVRSLLGTQG
jgi:indole-3-glycerol phosphate synthase